MVKFQMGGRTVSYCSLGEVLSVTGALLIHLPNKAGSRAGVSPGPTKRAPFSTAIGLDL